MNLIEVIDRKNNKKNIVTKIPGIDIIFQGDNNNISVYKDTKFRDCKLKMGGRNKIVIGCTNYVIHSIVLFANSDTHFIIGNDFCCYGLDVRLQENFTGIEIGNDCLFSKEICFYPTDGHAIISTSTGKCVNNLSRTIKVGNHVWCGRRVAFLKSSIVPSNTIIGFGSVITKEFSDEYTAIAGYPAKVIKTGVNWAREDPFLYNTKICNRESSSKDV